jgi:hypothetical protein
MQSQDYPRPLPSAFHAQCTGCLSGGSFCSVSSCCCCCCKATPAVTTANGAAAVVAAAAAAGAAPQVLQVAVLSFCFGFGVVYLVILRDILLGTPPDCNGLLCELFGLPVSSALYDARLVIILLALLVCSPLLLFRYSA